MCVWGGSCFVYHGGISLVLFECCGLFLLWLLERCFFSCPSQQITEFSSGLDFCLINSENYFAKFYDICNVIFVNNKQMQVQHRILEYAINVFCRSRVNSCSLGKINPNAVTFPRLKYWIISSAEWWGLTSKINDTCVATHAEQFKHHLSDVRECYVASKTMKTSHWVVDDILFFWQSSCS